MIKEKPSKGSVFSLTTGVIVFLSLISVFSYLIFSYKPTDEFPYGSALLLTGFLFFLFFVVFIYTPYQDMKQNRVYYVEGTSQSWSKKKVENMIENLPFEDGPFIYDVHVINWNDNQFSLSLSMEIDSSSVLEESKELVYRHIESFVQSKLNCTITDILFEITCFDHVKKGM